MPLRDISELLKKLDYDRVELLHELNSDRFSLKERPGSEQRDPIKGYSKNDFSKEVYKGHGFLLPVSRIYIETRRGSYIVVDDNTWQDVSEVMDDWHKKISAKEKKILSEFGLMEKDNG